MLRENYKEWLKQTDPKNVKKKSKVIKEIPVKESKAKAIKMNHHLDNSFNNSSLHSP